jgi:hypothetical protein
MSNKWWWRWLVVMLLLPVVNTEAQELVLYAIPSPRALNWRSPHTLFMSYLENIAMPNKYPGYRHPLGHLVVELRDSCRYEIAGVVAASRLELFNSVAKYRYGLGSLFTRYRGKIQTGNINLYQLADRYADGDVAYIKFLLNEETFEKLWQYLQEYKAKQYYKIYNGENKPREGKGAGCSAFAVSFVEMAGLLDSMLLKQWQVRVNVPNKLIGGPDGGNRHVGMLRMAFTQRWAADDAPGQKTITFYEPSKVYKWIKKAWKKGGMGYDCLPDNRGKSRGLIFDCRNKVWHDGRIWLTRI